MNKSFCIFLIEAELLNAIKACNGEFLGLLLVMMMFYMCHLQWPLNLC